MMASHISILVTGSRHARDPYSLTYELENILERHRPDSISCFVGDCPTGADRMFKQWWVDRCGSKFTITSPEPMLERYVSDPVEDTWSGGEYAFRDVLQIYHADWSGLGPSAGPQRNSLMVKDWISVGGTEAVALWLGDNGGTLDTIRKINKAGHGVKVLAV